MADAVTSQTIIDGEKKVVMKFTNVSDGSGESAVAKVDVSDCVLGTDINVPKLSGKQVKLTLPPKTKSGQIFRLAGQGMIKKNMEYGGKKHLWAINLWEP